MAVFDQYAADYDGWYDDKRGNFVDRVETELAFRLLEIKKGMWVLDFGCGTGNFSIKLARMGCNVTGVDVSGEMLKVARSKAREQNMDIEFIQGDVNSLTFANNSYDAVVSMATFEFIEHPLETLAELFRVVKPGGKVLVGTIARDSKWGKLYESEEVRSDSIFKYATFLTLDDLTSWEKDKLVGTGECLFIDPLADEDEFCTDRENELAGTQKGGFICTLWRR